MTREEIQKRMSEIVSEARMLDAKEHFDREDYEFMHKLEEEHRGLVKQLKELEDEN